MKYKIPNIEVIEVMEKFQDLHISGTGPDAVFEKSSMGWYVWLDGSYESLYLGLTKPELQPGDRVNIMIEKV